MRAPGRPFALLPAAIGLLAGLNLQIPYFAIEPGPAQDVQKLITISGTRTYPATSKLYLTTVRLRSVRVADALLGIVDPAVTVVPRDAIVPPRTTDKQQDRLNSRQMEDSKVAAAAAALKLLNVPGVRVIGSGARVEQVVPGSPADGVLEPGDVIVSVDGRPVNVVPDLTAVIQGSRSGTRFTLGVKRGVRSLAIEIRSDAGPEDRPIVGVTIVTQSERVDLPFRIDIRSNEIGGPSAGLMFALGIVDRLQDGDLANGLDIAGTGVIQLDGTVGEVGGVEQKVAAALRARADVFLVPRREAPVARRAAGSLRIIPVGSLREAVDALADLGRPVRASGAGRAPG